MTNPLVLYHDQCVDGFTAAWCAWLLYGDAAEYVAVQYGQPPPVVAGRDVLVLDFSYPRYVMLRMAAEAKSLCVLDHHKSAEAAIGDLPFVTFDMNRSGAGLAWDVLHSGAPRRWLIDYVEDRDLWRWKLKLSKEVSARIGVHPRDFEAWCELDAASVEDVADEGSGILLAIEAYVRTHKSHARRALWEESEPEFWIVNTTAHISELVGALAEGEPFAMGWFQRADGVFVYSLRSREGGADVSALAAEYGGGGHRHAAGFTSKHLLFLDMLTPKNRLLTNPRLALLVHCGTTGGYAITDRIRVSPLVIRDCLRLGWIETTATGAAVLTDAGKALVPWTVSERRRGT